MHFVVLLWLAVLVGLMPVLLYRRPGAERAWTASGCLAVALALWLLMSISIPWRTTDEDIVPVVNVPTVDASAQVFAYRSAQGDIRSVTTQAAFGRPLPPGSWVRVSHRAARWYGGVSYASTTWPLVQFSVVPADVAPHQPLRLAYPELP